ncbi:hypothetical protein OHB04_30570 [Streptomyces sp. NBC_01775]|uniref:hypothetical protein n=1 Tax=Streptomyces sp. NBC_01775 TaxID=2975939 RepID=UPI002DD9B309|nr:hypothetical protein [Streptomyces sp. NBC_01775]WSB79642.1 hypothetical protein OHB04_30570 [Streptomyces sp. NBC_01775]
MTDEGETTPTGPGGPEATSPDPDPSSGGTGAGGTGAAAEPGEPETGKAADAAAAEAEAAPMGRGTTGPAAPDTSGTAAEAEAEARSAGAGKAEQDTGGSAPDAGADAVAGGAPASAGNTPADAAEKPKPGPGGPRGADTGPETPAPAKPAAVETGTGAGKEAKTPGTSDAARPGPEEPAAETGAGHATDTEAKDTGGVRPAVDADDDAEAGTGSDVGKAAGHSVGTGRGRPGAGVRAKASRAASARAGAARAVGVRRMVWGGALALVATAGMLAVTLPMNASGDSDEARTAGRGSALPGSVQGEGPPAKVQDAPAASGSGRGRQPLTGDERTRAWKIALSGGQGLRGAGEDVTGKAGAPQHVATDLAEDEGSGGARTAEVYFYDYADDALIHKSVDLTASKVAHSEKSHGAQPPPAWAEAHEAAELLVKDPLGAGLRADYRGETGKDLKSADQLGTQGLGYVPREARGDALAKCGKQRCVRLFTRVAGGGPWIDTQRFVINLSDRTVHRLTAR